MNKLSHYLRFFLPVVLWAGVIFAFSSFPTGTTSEVHWQDFVVKKLAHVTEYAVFTLLTYRALFNSGVSRGSAIKCAVFLSVLYGATDEFHQSFTPGREPRARDVIFDTIGAGIAALSLWKLQLIPQGKLRRWAENYQLI